MLRLELDRVYGGKSSWKEEAGRQVVRAQEYRKLCIEVSKDTVMGAREIDRIISDRLK